MKIDINLYYSKHTKNFAEIEMRNAIRLQKQLKLLNDVRN